MAASSATTTSSSGSYLQEDIKKRKRMISNRESARRSRMRKQSHLNELVTQLSQLRSECNRVMGRIRMTTQFCMSVEAENSVLRAQVAELNHRLRSLNDIIGVMKQPIDAGSWYSDEQYGGGGGELNDSLSCLYACQPVMGSSEMIMY